MMLIKYNKYNYYKYALQQEHKQMDNEVFYSKEFFDAIMKEENKNSNKSIEI